MDVPEIRDRENLEAWLKTRSQQECVVIAHRAAMRVAPLWIDNPSFIPATRNRIVTEIVFLRPMLISGVGAFGFTPEIKNAARIAANAASSAYDNNGDKAVDVTADDHLKRCPDCRTNVS